MADAIDEALASGEATVSGSSRNERGYQVGNQDINAAEVDRWRKLRAIVFQVGIQGTHVCYSGATSCYLAGVTDATQAGFWPILADEENKKPLR